jgi:hypothetical protein
LGYTFSKNGFFLFICITNLHFLICKHIYKIIHYVFNITFIE